MNKIIVLFLLVLNQSTYASDAEGSGTVAGDGQGSGTESLSSNKSHQPYPILICQKKQEKTVCFISFTKKGTV